MDYSVPADCHSGSKDGADTAGTARNVVDLEGGGKALLSLGSGDVKQIAFAGLSLVIQQMQRSACINNGLRLNATMRGFLQVYRWAFC